MARRITREIWMVQCDCDGFMYIYMYLCISGGYGIGGVRMDKLWFRPRGTRYEGDALRFLESMFNKGWAERASVKYYMFVAAFCIVWLADARSRNSSARFIS